MGIVTSPRAITAMGLTTISLGSLVQSRLLRWHRVTAYVLSIQPRAARRGIFARMGTSVSGAITAVPRPVPSRASTLSHWHALCSVWKAATHTALRVRHLPLGQEGLGGVAGLSGKGFPVVLSFTPWCPVPIFTTLGSASRCPFIQARPAMIFVKFGLYTMPAYLWAYHQKHFLIELSGMMGKFCGKVAPVSEELKFQFYLVSVCIEI